MPTIRLRLRRTKEGQPLPCTEIRLGRHLLRLPGRPGPQLSAAVARLEAEEAKEAALLAEMRACWPGPSDPRD